METFFLKFHSHTPKQKLV